MLNSDDDLLVHSHSRAFLPLDLTIKAYLFAMLASLLVTNLVCGAPPLPTARQLEFMEMETIQFMHYNVDTSWKPSRSAVFFFSFLL